MDLPFEALVIIFLNLTPNDIMEASAICKLFYRVSRKNKLFAKKLDDSKKLLKVDKSIFNSPYVDFLISFSNQLFVSLEKYVNEDNLFLVKDVLMDRLYHSVLPFCVWNHLFLCQRLNSMASICGYCTKLFIKNKKISDHINNNLFVHTSESPNQLKQVHISEFPLTQKVPLFVHTNVVTKNNKSNFGEIYYESIGSSFMLWKFYLDILCRIVFNVSHELIFPLLMSGNDLNCRDFTVCTSKHYSNLKKSKVKVIFFRELVEFCKNLSVFCCDNVDSYFIIER